MHPGLDRRTGQGGRAVVVIDEGDALRQGTELGDRRTPRPPSYSTVKVKPESAVAVTLIGTDDRSLLGPVGGDPSDRVVSQLVNHNAPSGPAVMPSGPEMVGDV